MLSFIVCFSFRASLHTLLAHEKTGILNFVVMDGDSGVPTPARVELLDIKGQAYIPEDALLVGDNHSQDHDQWVWEGSGVSLSKAVPNIYTGTDQFYTDGKFKISLPVGAYTLKIFKGNEYLIAARKVDISVDKVTEMKVELSRWINPIKQGWYSADDHLHIARPDKTGDVVLSKWMQAEDLRFANLLQWGNAQGFGNAVQHTHGALGVYRKDDYFLVSAQENPRSDVMGHAIILGAKSPIHIPDSYLIYKHFFEEAKRQGALSGFAHHGTGFTSGLDLVNHDLVNFIEVQQLGIKNYDFWYKILNTGIRMTPTAGTDFMGFSYPYPGRDRFYTQIKGPISFDGWLEGIRTGRTFVTNGPILEFTVNNEEIGGEVILKKPGSISINGRVLFDSTRDDVDQFEIIQNGEVLQNITKKSVTEKNGTKSIQVSFNCAVQESSWFALRFFGRKVGEINERKQGEINEESSDSISMGHTGAIYVRVEDALLKAHPRAKAVFQEWINELEGLKNYLDENNYNLAPSKWPNAGADGITLDSFRKQRPELLRTIQEAQEYFSKQLR